MLRLCECGCGKPTNIARQNDRRLGYVKGEPMKFVTGHHLRKRKTLREAFMKYFTPGVPGECWEWAGQYANTGYGRVSLNGERILAHRASYQIHKGEIPAGLHVCHACDNKRCVNPDHLFLGSHQDNIRDATEKGIMANGERAGASKLTAADVIAIRNLRNQGWLQRELAEKFGIAASTVSFIVNRKTWAKIAQEDVR